MNTTIQNPELTAHKWDSFIKLLWIEVYISAISCIVGVFDVREYYAVGRWAFFALEMFFVAMGIWLVMAISRRKSWARKTYVILTILGLLGTVLAACSSNYKFLVSDNFMICLAELASSAISAYCVFLCFSHKREFVQDSEKTGTEATVNRYQCIAYLSVLTVGIAAVFAMRFVRPMISDRYYDDLMEAAANGSKDAERELTEELYGAYLLELPANDRNDPHILLDTFERAAQDTESIINEIREAKRHENAQSQSQSSRATQLTRGVGRAWYAYGDDIGRFFFKIFKKFGRSFKILGLGFCILIGAVFKKRKAVATNEQDKKRA